MNRLKKVFDNLDLEVSTNDLNEEGGHELQELSSSPPRRRRASSADYCIEGRLKGGSFCDSADGDNNDDKTSTTNHEFPRRRANPRRGGMFPKRHSTSDCLDQRYITGNASDGNQNSASSFGFDFSEASSKNPLAVDNPHEIKKLDSQNSFPDFVGALGARHLALQAAADAAKDKNDRKHDELCDSDHIDPDKERMHYSEDLRGSFAAVQPKEARLRRSKHLAKFKQNRSDDNLDGSGHSNDSGYDSSSSFGSVGDLILKVLTSAGQDLESETAASAIATNISNARAPRRRTTKAAHQHRTRRQHARGSYAEGMVQPKTGFGQNLPCIAPTPQGFGLGGRRGSDFCCEQEEIIYRRRSSASYASRRRSSRSAISNKGNDDSDDSDDDEKQTNNIKGSPSRIKSKISHKSSGRSAVRRRSHRRASQSSKADKTKNMSPTNSQDSGRSSGSSCRSEALEDRIRRASAADQSCDSFKTLASIEAAMKRNRFAPV